VRHTQPVRTTQPVAWRLVLMGSRTATWLAWSMCLVAVAAVARTQFATSPAVVSFPVPSPTCRAAISADDGQGRAAGYAGLTLAARAFVGCCSHNPLRCWSGCAGGRQPPPTCHAVRGARPAAVEPVLRGLPFLTSDPLLWAAREPRDPGGTRTAVHEHDSLARWWLPRRLGAPRSRNDTDRRGGIPAYRFPMVGDRRPTKPGSFEDVRVTVRSTRPTKAPPGQASGDAPTTARGREERAPA
jgi:hypothetical protein